jgi:hypothetical protein
MCHKDSLQEFSRCDGAHGSRFDKMLPEKIQSSRPRQLVRLCIVSTDVMWVHECVISAGVGIELMSFSELCQFGIELAHII